MLLLLPAYGCSNFPGVSELTDLFDSNEYGSSLAKVYRTAPRDYRPQVSSLPPNKAIEKARQYKGVGKMQSAVNILGRAYMAYPSNPQIAAEYGKTLTAIGKPRDAQNVLLRAINLGVNDWRIFSALGVAYDRSGYHKYAQKSYASALALSPYEAVIYNNLGLSLAYAGRFEDAEEALRKAVSLPDVTEKMRANLRVIMEHTGSVSSEDNRQYSNYGTQQYSNYNGNYNKRRNYNRAYNYPTNRLPLSTGSINPDIAIPKRGQAVSMLSNVEQNQGGGGILGSSSDRPVNTQRQQTNGGAKMQYPTAPTVRPVQGSNVVVPQSGQNAPRVGVPRYPRSPASNMINVPRTAVPSRYKSRSQITSFGKRSRVSPWRKIKNMDGMFKE